jgi:hypothetical protein
LADPKLYQIRRILHLLVLRISEGSWKVLTRLIQVHPGKSRVESSDHLPNQTLVPAPWLRRSGHILWGAFSKRAVPQCTKTSESNPRLLQRFWQPILELQKSHKNEALFPGK